MSPPDPRHRIAPGLFGWLESPRPDDILQDFVSISGWAFSGNAPIARIIARGFGPDVELECRTRRDDVAAVYTRDDEALSSGFSGYVERPGESTGKPALEIWARLRDDREVRLFTWSPARARLRRWVQSSLLGPVREYQARAGVTISSSAATRWFERSCRLELQAFLESGARLVCPQPDTPRVSVVIALRNRAELTLRALRPVCAEREIPLEVVLVDNASTDETAVLLKRVSGATVLTNLANLGFTLAANQGAGAARGELLLFLNSDAVMHPGALLSLTRALDRSDAVGAAGGKLIWPNGRLQEAGANVWRDGSCEAYGRDGDPAGSEYSFERDVDFCSGAMLLTRRELFLRLGGFDERYRPAYYEDVDYCVRLLRAGFRVIYTPHAAATHVEFASSKSSGDAVRLQRERQAIFVNLHRDWLADRPSPSDRSFTASANLPHRPRALIVDDVAPDPAMGAGFPRAAAMVRALKRLGWLVTIYPTSGTPPDRPNREFPDIEVLRPGGPQGLGRAFRSLPDDTRVVIVSRSHNMRYVKAAAGRDLAGVGCPVIYDVEAVPALREIARRRLTGETVPDADVAVLLRAEVGLAHGCAAVLAVNQAEQRHYLEGGIANVSVLGHAIESFTDPLAVRGPPIAAVRRRVFDRFAERGRDPLSNRCGLPGAAWHACRQCAARHRRSRSSRSIGRGEA